VPTISFAFSDFQALLGKRITPEQFEDLLALYVKAEVENYDKQSGEVNIKLDDTNLPYLWCPEGIARCLKNALGMQKGIARLDVKASSYRIIVDDSVKKVRPYLAAFVAKGKKLDDYALKQLVQMQEKFCESYGRRRQKVSIGLYSYKRITFPVHYKAVAPDSARFQPLESERELTLKQILEQHPKGQQYAWILKDSTEYPLLVDYKNEILSFPPIINSNFTGKLEIGDNEMLFEATGTDEESLNLAANIFAQNLAERGFEIYSVKVSYKTRTVISPAKKSEKVRVTPKDVEELIGIKITQPQLNALLLKAGYDTKNGLAVIPNYRADILHPVDVLEDIAIAYGFDKLPDAPLSSYTLGKEDSSIASINELRKLAVGMGFQEIFSHILTDKSTVVDPKLSVELQNCMSETFSAVRDSILPQLLEVISKNKHADYPQRIFEEGMVASQDGQKVTEWHSLALASAHSKADFTEQKQYVLQLMKSLGIAFTIKPSQHPLFLKGRAGGIIVNGKAVGVIGEISPAILSKWQIEMPTTAMELNFNLLMNF